MQSTIIRNPLIWLVGFAGLAILSLVMFWSFAQSEDAEQGVFRVYVEASRAGNLTAKTGSSFLVSGSTFLITNYHVVKGADRILIQFLENDGDASATTAKLLWFSIDRDLAILETNTDLPGHALALANLSDGDLEKRDIVSAIGFPGAADSIGQAIAGRDAREDIKNKISLDATVSTGTIQRILVSTNRRMIQHSANVNRGNSGGPLIDSCDRVIGVNTLSQVASIDGEKLRQAVTGVRDELVFQTPGSLEFAVHIREALSALSDADISVRRSRGKCVSGVSGDEWLAVQASAALSIVALILFGITYRANPTLRFPKEVFAQHLPVRTSMATAVDQASQNWNAEPAGATIRLRPMSGGPDIALSSETLRPGGRGIKLGRSQAQADIVIHDDSVSRLHAVITLEADGAFGVTDMGSANGVFLNGAKLSPHNRAPLHDADILTLGSVKYTFDAPAQLASSSPDDENSMAEEEWLLSGFDRQGGVVQIQIARPTIAKSVNEFTEVCLVGRGSQCNAVIQDASISRAHANIGFLPDLGIAIRDLHSSNGTFVDGVRLTNKVVAIASAKNIRFGEIELLVSRQK